MTISITPYTLCNLSYGHFTLEACEALEDYFNECGVDMSACTVGDICISFSEVPAEWRLEYEEDCIIAELSNGNILVAE